MMRVVKVAAICSACGFEWWTRKVREACPVCYAENETGWTSELEEKILAESAGQPVTV
jgi:predicted Zn-ribbon and HTH transcriptional regulator